MTTRRLLISFFLLYGLIILIFAREFVAQNISASIAMIGSSMIVAILLWSKRATFINVILAFYVFQSYLTRPFISIFEKELSPKNLQYIEQYSSYFSPEACAVVYWSLFSLLFAWLMGLILLRGPQKDSHFYPPKIFIRIDQAIIKGGFPFILAFSLLLILNYRSIGSGLRGSITGEDTTLFLWGLASLATISVVCLYVFLLRRHFQLKPCRSYLVVLSLVSVLGSALSGSRSSVYVFIIIGLCYWLILNISKKWTLGSLFKASSLLFILLTIAAISALFAQALRPMYRYAESFNASDILSVIDFQSVVLVKENILFGITQLLHRLSALQAQFYVLNDWYVHDPLQYYNPVQAFMRIVNDLFPGDIFPGILTINQLFNYIYFGTYIHYASETWGIQSTLYLYFGHIGAPIVVFLLALLINHYYPVIEKALIISPAFAAFIILFLFDFFSNGTAERVIPIDVVRPIASFIIFLFLCKVFSSVFRSLHQAVKKSKGTLTNVI